MTETTRPPKDFITATVKTGITAYEGNVAEFITFAQVMKNSEYMTGNLLQAKTLELMRNSVKEEKYEDAQNLRSLYTSFGDSTEFTRNAEKIREFNELSTQITLAETSANEVTAQDIMRMTIKVENCAINGNTEGFPKLCEQLDKMCDNYTPVPDEAKFNLKTKALAAQLKATQNYTGEDMYAHTPVILDKMKTKAEEMFHTDPVGSFDIVGKIIHNIGYPKDACDKNLGEQYAVRAARIVLDFAHASLPHEITSKETPNGQANIFSSEMTTVDTLLKIAINKTAAPDNKPNHEIEDSARAYLQKRFLSLVEKEGFETAFRKQQGGSFTFDGIIGPLSERNDDFVRKLPTDKKKQEIFLNMVKISVDQFDETYKPTEFVPKKPAAGGEIGIGIRNPVPGMK